jgi:hypothetical protein
MKCIFLYKKFNLDCQKTIERIYGEMTQEQWFLALMKQPTSSDNILYFIQNKLINPDFGSEEVTLLSLYNLYNGFYWEKSFDNILSYDIGFNINLQDKYGENILLSILKRDYYDKEDFYPDERDDEFIENYNNFGLLQFKIDMINSNYKVNMQIDRAKLFSLLLKKKIKSSFEPCIRACVIIKYTPEIDNNDFKEISIFVFQKGNIIITGARRKSHIMASYKYINNILITHSEEISKKDEKDEEDLILDLYNDILKDVESGLISI